MKKSFQLLMALAAPMVMFNACSKDDVAEENSREVITTIELQFTERGTTNVLSYEWEDLDGDGGQNPEIDNILLSANKTYDLEIEFYDKSKDPVVDISEEIDEEGDVHRVYLEPSEGSNISITNVDLDKNQKPLGLNAEVQTGEAGNGTLKLTLKHYENGGKESSDPVNSTKSSTDASVSFITMIEL